FEPILSDAAQELNVTNEGGVAGTIRLLKNVAGLWLAQESRRQWQREGISYGWEELLALADQAAPFASLIDPDAPEFLHAGDMPERIRAFCRRTGQPAPASVGAVVRCCLESLALRYRWVIEALERVAGVQIDVIRVVGGGSQNRLLCQYTADACRRPVVAGPVEATALGNVMVQAIASGTLPDIAAGRRAIAASVDQQSFEPRAPEAWDAAFERFAGLLST
ncbi:MAG TPA: FGGY-family carbohydrate kinase, partial [Roseiflexaceae bacterium]